MMYPNEKRPDDKTLRRWWGPCADRVIEHLQQFFASQGFDDVYWSVERPMHFGVRRRRGDLLDEFYFEGGQVDFSGGIFVSSFGAYDWSNSMRLYECTGAYRKLKLSVPVDVPARSVITAGMPALMYHGLGKQPAPLFYVDHESKIDDTLKSFEQNFLEIAPIAFDAFANERVIADFLMGARMPDKLRAATKQKGNLYTGMANERVFLNAALLYASIGQDVNALAAIDHFEKVTDAAFAGKRISSDQYEDNVCNVMRVREKLRTG